MPKNREEKRKAMRRRTKTPKKRRWRMMIRGGRCAPRDSASSGAGVQFEYLQ